MDNIQITKDCIQTTNNIGSTIYQNICNGTVNTVYWGTGDWLGAIFISLLLLFIITIFFILIFLIGRELFSN